MNIDTSTKSIPVTRPICWAKQVASPDQGIQYTVRPDSSCPLVSLKALGPGRLTYQGMEVNSHPIYHWTLYPVLTIQEAWPQHSDNCRAHFIAHRCKDSTSSSIILFSVSSKPPYTPSLSSEIKQLLLPKWTITADPTCLKTLPEHPETSTELTGEELFLPKQICKVWRKCSITQICIYECKTIQGSKTIR